MQCWCIKCSLEFPDTESRGQHIWYSGAHIYCQLCLASYGNVTIMVEEFDDEEALENHCRTHHFSTSYCSNCDSHHHGCSECFDQGSIIDFSDKSELIEHVQMSHPSTEDYEKSENSDSGCEGAFQFKCYECFDGMDFEEQGELSSHLRVCHGWVDCPHSFLSGGSCSNPPQISWTAKQMAHMAECYHPNPCNDFDGMKMEGCHLCDVPFSNTGDILRHYRTFHRCHQCSYYISIYYETKHEHLWEYHGEDVPRPKANSEYKKRPKRSRNDQSSTTQDEEANSSPEPESVRDEGPIDIYAILGLSPQCSHKEAKRAARQRRIETHPDKLKKCSLSTAEKSRVDEMAMLVGFAADIILDPVKRQQYDQEIFDWSISRGYP